MSHTRDGIRFNVLRNALYHTGRRRSFEFWSRFFNFAVVVLGAAAVGDLLSGLGVTPEALGAAVAVIGALQLVLDFGGRAREHQVLQRSYYALLAEVEETAVCDAQACARFYSSMIRITADEPPVLRALDAKAYNDALGALEAFGPEQRLRIPLLHRLLGGVFSFEGHEYRKRGESGAA